VTTLRDTFSFSTKYAHCELEGSEKTVRNNNNNNNNNNSNNSNNNHAIAGGPG